MLGGVEYGHHKTFNLKSIEIGEENSLLTSKVTFQCMVTTSLSSYVPPEDPTARIPVASREWVEENFASLSSVYSKTQTDEIIDNVISSIGSKCSEISGNVEEMSQAVGEIQDLIPTQASKDNQLADKAFVNSSINNYAAFYLTKNANGDAFGTYAELTSATKFWNAGVEKTPTKNDYLVVLEDETKTTSLGVHPTTRYTYQGEWPTG